MSSRSVVDFETVTLLCTANLGSDLTVFPRLSTLIQQQRQAAEGPVFLLDLGDSGTLDAWICRVTQGRAPLLILDGIGYDAALIGGPERLTIPPASLTRLRQSLVMPVIPWDTVAQITKRGVTLNLATGSATLPPDEAGVQVDRSGATLPLRGSEAVIVGDVPGGMLARVVLAWPAWTVHEADLLALSDDIAPDPSIAALMDFVESEARFYAHQQGGSL